VLIVACGMERGMSTRKRVAGERRESLSGRGEEGKLLDVVGEDESIVGIDDERETTENGSRSRLL
jgi:hypothetical protein